MAAPALLNTLMPPIPRNARRTRGRSLVEVVTAIGLAAILLAIAVPNFSQLRGPYTMRQATQQISSEFQKARMRAIATNTRYRFTYSSSTKTYALERETAPSTWTAEYSNQLPDLVSITSPSIPPIFDTRGLLNQAYDIPVSVQGYSTTRTVSINVLGKITVS